MITPEQLQQLKDMVAELVVDNDNADAKEHEAAQADLDATSADVAAAQADADSANAKGVVNQDVADLKTFIDSLS